MLEGVDLIQAARIVKSNGTDGEILMSFRDILPADIDIHEPVFIYSDGLPVPFFIENLVRRGNDKALVRLNDIRSFEDAEEIVGQPVYVNAACYGDVMEEGEGDFSMLVAWKLCDEHGVECGVISDFEDIPGNPCLYVDMASGEQTMIPLHDELVIDIDEEHQVLTMKIPEGLLG